MRSVRRLVTLDADLWRRVLRYEKARGCASHSEAMRRLIDVALEHFESVPAEIPAHLCVGEDGWRNG